MAGNIKNMANLSIITSIWSSLKSQKISLKCVIMNRLRWTKKSPQFCTILHKFWNYSQKFNLTKRSKNDGYIVQFKFLIKILFS